MPCRQQQRERAVVVAQQIPVPVELARQVARPSTRFQVPSGDWRVVKPMDVAARRFDDTEIPTDVGAEPDRVDHALRVKQLRVEHPAAIQGAGSRRTEARRLENVRFGERLEERAHGDGKCHDLNFTSLRLATLQAVTLVSAGFRRQRTRIPHESMRRGETQVFTVNTCFRDSAGMQDLTLALVCFATQFSVGSVIFFRIWRCIQPVRRALSTQTHSCS